MRIVSHVDIQSTTQLQQNIAIFVIYYNILDMNISVYLPVHLKDRFDSYVKNREITANGAIRKAIELLLKQDKKSTWGSWMDDFKGDPSFKDLDSYRSDLKAPSKNIF